MVVDTDLRLDLGSAGSLLQLPYGRLVDCEEAFLVDRNSANEAAPEPAVVLKHLWRRARDFWGKAIELTLKISIERRSRRGRTQVNIPCWYLYAKTCTGEARGLKSKAGNVFI